MTKKTYPCFELMEVGKLAAHPDRVRTPDNDALYQLGRSLSRFGILRPVVFNATTGFILDGDHVLQQWRDSGAEVIPVWCVEVPVELEDVVHLALNNHVGSWQWQPVSECLKAMKEKNIDVMLTGFHSSDVSPLLAANWSPADKGLLDGTDPAQQSLL